jgi:hypothetical protein
MIDASWRVVRLLVFGLLLGENAGKAVRVQCKGNDSELEVRLGDREQQLASSKD